jgi:hypothetical protein
MLAVASIISLLGFFTQTVKAQEVVKTELETDAVNIKKTKKKKAEIDTAIGYDSAITILVVSICNRGSKRKT